MEARDVITCEIHPKIGGYFTHVERTFCLGEPDRELQRIYDGCLAAFRRGMELFGPDKSIAACMNEVKRVIDDAGLGICETGIHGHGLASLEYPRYRFHALKADQAALARSAASSSLEWFLPSISIFSTRNGATAKPVRCSLTPW